MSGSNKTILRSPAQASQVFGGAGVPRQRHVFLVRFRPGTASAGSLSPVTFVVKHCDRPKIAPKTEELNQYNKKRVIYTGFKYEPIRMTFYDSADGAAQNLWNQYAKYYFGDFANGANNSYGYDITTTPFTGSSFGLSEGYAGNNDNSSQWFFNCIEIYHFYYMGGAHMYDSYFLYNPRIQSYEPDDLDYENSSVSQINMSFLYENLQYNPGQAVTSGAFDEFVNLPFFGNPLEVPGSLQASIGAYDNAQGSSVNPNISNLLSSATSAAPSAAPYRYTASNATGALSMFGNYGYGGATPPTLASTAVNGALLNNISAGVGNTLSSPYGNVGPMLTSALLGTNGGLTTTAQGSSLPSAAFGSINAQQNGTAQYGFNNTVGSFDNDPNAYAASLASSSNATVDDMPPIV
jgi:hypothetical protein